MPIFAKQFYYDRVKEDIELFSALSVNIQAESPLQRNMIYTTSRDDFFEIDYRTGKSTILIFFLIQIYLTHYFSVMKYMLFLMYYIIANIVWLSEKIKFLIYFSVTYIMVIVY